MTDAKILIVGAGIAGLSLARRLSQHGLDYRLIEKKPAAEQSGTGIALPFNATRALKQMGLFSEVMKTAHSVDEIIYSKDTGRLLAKTDLKQTPFTQENFIALERRALHQALLQGIKDKVHFNTELEQLIPQARSSQVICSNPELSGDYDLVIAADGIHSPTRNACHPQQQTLYNHRVSNWRCIIDAPQHGLQPTYMFGNTDLFMAYPISANQIYCYAHIHDDSKQHKLSGEPLQDLHQVFSHYGEPARSLLPKISNQQLVTGKLQSVTEARFYHQRVAFVGDAANGCSPLIQQGAAAAFEDVICLADMLKQNPIDKALEAYQQTREERIRWIINYSDAPFSKLTSMDSAIARFIRNNLIRLIGPLNVFGWKKLQKLKGYQPLAIESEY